MITALHKKYLQYPFDVSIETQCVCNAHCAFCPYHSLKRKGKRLSTSSVTQLMDKLKEIDAPFRLNLSRVNEPLLDERIPYFYEQAALNLPQASLTLFSNASLLDKEQRKWILALPGLSLNISLNEYDRDAYLKTMRLDYDKVLWNIRGLHQTMGDSKMYVNVTRAGTGDAEDDAFLAFVQENFPKFHSSVYPRFTWLTKGAGNVAVPDLPCLQYFSLHVLADGTFAHCSIDGGGEFFTDKNISEYSLWDVYRKSPVAPARESLLSRRNACSPCNKCDSLCEPEIPFAFG